jgi:hypothetical protein
VLARLFIHRSVTKREFDIPDLPEWHVMPVRYRLSSLRELVSVLVSYYWHPKW